MSFVPVTGPATFRPADPPREGVVEFSDERRTVALPIRAALPVLTKAHARDDVHPSVGLLSGAALLTGSLYAWLTSPRKFASGTKMTFAGLSNGQDRANVIAWLNTQGSNVPLPAVPAADSAKNAAAKPADGASAAAATASGAPAAAASAAPAAK